MKSNKKAIKKVISINIDKDIVDKIDKKRNGVPRSPYINKILRQWLRKKQ